MHTIVNRSVRRLFRRSVLCPLAAFCAFLCLAGFAIAKPVKFDIPAQPAGDALIVFSKQSGMDVLYAYKDLQEARSTVVAGEYEPDRALALLLKGTGFTATQDSGKFVIARAKADATASVKGSLTGEGGKGLSGALVAIRETAQSTSTDRHGQYVFPKVAAGTYVLVATAPGYQPLHITDVVVKVGNDLVLGKEEMRQPLDEVTKLDPIVVHADSVTELEKMEVTGTRGKPFEGANVDIPRTINDVQPYHIFDASMIDQSGATSVEAFLKERLTMNAVALTNGQSYGQVTGNLSTIDLRGLGPDKTLVLVNGRRLANVSIGSNYYQPDVNGLPVSAIERIEVLPSSASGIYGGNAIGGVINIILKRDYSGGELRANYDNSFDSDTARRTVSLSYGWSLEGGKTHVMITASRSDSNALLLQDRQEPLLRGQTTILHNAPSYYYSATNPVLGATPNIAPVSSAATTLTLKNGVSLGSRNTYIPAGTAPGGTAAALYPSLLANAGSWNFDLPAGTQTETSLLRPAGSTPKLTSFMANVRRQMRPWLEVFGDFSYNENRTYSLYSPFTASFRVTAASAINPFNADVNVRFPDARALPSISNSTNRRATVGFLARLPKAWTAEFDYTWSENRYNYLFASLDSGAVNAALLSGTLNPFVDTLLYPLDLDPYLAPVSYHGATRLQDFALRGSGPLPSLPWGAPMLTAGLEHRGTEGKDKVYQIDFPVTTTNSYYDSHYPLKAETASAYAEASVPLVKKDWLPFVRSLDLQLAGRVERFTVDSGTPYARTYFERNPVLVSYPAPVRNGAPYFERTSYDSKNYTFGFKYQPVADLTLRVSRATAFLPPTPDQLAPANEPNPTKTTVTDPTNGSRVAVTVVAGGNPALTPQHSQSTNLGLIWTPHAKRLQGLRVNVEYYKIEQFDYIDNLSARQIVDFESIFPERVARDSAGVVTTVDATKLNLYHRSTEGWDMSVDYTRQTGIGAFNLHAAASRILHLENQFLATKPAYDAAGYAPAEGGGPKDRGNATLTWERRGWTAGWTTRYTGSYKQYGAPGSPVIAMATSPILVVLAGNVIAAQGGDTIPSQLYHDLFVGYAFGERAARAGSRLRATADTVLSGLTLQLGVRNIFDQEPPFDAYYSSNYYLSGFGDARLRTYWVNLKKAF
jgi:outer membrane receptor protein involved in Fe transport